VIVEPHDLAMHGCALGYMHTKAVHVGRIYLKSNYLMVRRAPNGSMTSIKCVNYDHSIASQRHVHLITL